MNMNLSLAMLALLAPLTSQAQEYSWFEDEWVSDTEATIAINPEYRDGDEATLVALREIYGRIRWNIEGNELTFIDPTTTPAISSTNPFTIHPIDSTSFDIVIEQSLPKNDSDNSFDYEALDLSEIQTNSSRYVITITKTENGFCIIPKPNFIVVADGSRTMLKYECFEPYDP